MENLLQLWQKHYLEFNYSSYCKYKNLRKAVAFLFFVLETKKVKSNFAKAKYERKETPFSVKSGRYPREETTKVVVKSE